MIVGEKHERPHPVLQRQQLKRSEKHISLEMISQGSSEVSVMFVIETEQEKQPLEMLYDAFS